MTLQKQIRKIVSEELVKLNELDHRQGGVAPFSTGFPEEPVSSQAVEYFGNKLAGALSDLEKSLKKIDYVIAELQNRHQDPGTIIQLKDALVENRNKLVEMLSKPHEW